LQISVAARSVVPGDVSSGLCDPVILVSSGIWAATAGPAGGGGVEAYDY